MTQPLLAGASTMYQAADEELISAAAEVPEAFGDVYRRFMPRVYRYLRARAHSPDEAEDLTQGVFLRAFGALPNYRARGGGFAAWLFRIARNASIDAQRRRRATVPLHVVAHEEQIDDTATSPEAHAEREERRTQLRRLVAALDPDKQELLALRYAADLSSREIAALLGKSDAAVKKSLTRTLSALKEHYVQEAI